MTDAPPQTRYRWVICGLLFFATTINYVDRQILALLKPILDEQLALDQHPVRRDQFGLPGLLRPEPVPLRMVHRQVRHQDRLYAFHRLVELGRDEPRTGQYHCRLLRRPHCAGPGRGRKLSRGNQGDRAVVSRRRNGHWPRASSIPAPTSGPCLRRQSCPRSPIHMGWHWAFIFAGIAGLVWVAVWWPLFDAPEQSRRVSAGELAFIESDAPDPERGRRQA